MLRRPRTVAYSPAMRIWLVLAALSGFVAVALGAAGAHAFKAALSPERMGWLDTGLRYHLVHTLALLAVAILIEAEPRPTPALRLAPWLFAGGIVLFSFGLYAMALGGVRSLGPAVPTGGVLFMAGWLALAAHALMR